MAGRLSRSGSERLKRSLPVDRDRLTLSSRWGEVRLSVRLPFSSALPLEGDADFLLRSLGLSVLSEGFLSLDLLRPRPLSLAPVSLVLLTLSLDSLGGLSADLLRLRRLELDLVASVESRLDLTLLLPREETAFPELLLCRCSPFLILASGSSSEPEL